MSGFGSAKVIGVDSMGVRSDSRHRIGTFDYPAALPDDSFALRGQRPLDCQGATADTNDSSLELNYGATNVYLVAGDAGTVTVVRDGEGHDRSEHWAPDAAPRPSCCGS